MVLGVLAVWQFRDGSTRSASTRPTRPTTTTAYVPAVVRGDPIPVVHAPSGVKASRSDGKVTGFALAAPGAKPDDWLGVVMYAPTANIDFERSDGIRVHRAFGPGWLYIRGPLEPMNAALATLRYEARSSARDQVLQLVVSNETLGTNTRELSVPIQVT